MHNLHRAEECRHLKFYDQAGETLTLRALRGNLGWKRFVIRYEDILAYHQFGVHLEFLMKQGSVLIAGFNMPSLLLLLEKRVLRSLRVVVRGEISQLNDPVYEQFNRDIITNCIVPEEILFSAEGILFNPPETTPGNAVLN